MAGNKHPSVTTHRGATTMGTVQSRPPPKPYDVAGPRARYFKALIQMAIGVIAVLGVGIWLVVKLFERPFPSVHDLSDGIFGGVGFALGLAAVVELAYTLFTDGPDEALNPVMLGVAAALLIQLGRVETFKLGEALAGLLYAAALAGLFATRRWLAEPEDEESWSPPAGWLKRWRRGSSKTGE